MLYLATAFFLLVGIVQTGAIAGLMTRGTSSHSHSRLLLAPPTSATARVKVLATARRSDYRRCSLGVEAPKILPQRDPESRQEPTDR